MPEHAEVFAHCPNVVKEYVSPPPGAHHTSLYTNQIVEEIHARHAREALEAQAQVYATTYHQPPQASSRMQSRAPSRVQSPSYSYQAYRPPRPSSGFEVREREVMEDGWEMRGVEEALPRTPTPPSPTNPYIAAALLNGTTDDNDIATITRSSAADVEAIPDAILDPSPETTIHPKGNLLLVVGPSTRQRSLLVQAETIEHFGPLWQELIKDSNRERLLSTRRTAYLPADDADMMLVVMYLSHSWHLGKVPRELSFPQLLAMTRICDKYDMNTQVSPFARRWIVPHQEMLLSPGREQWLFVARQFGLERHYVTLANHLVLGCWTEGGRTLFTPGRGEKLEGLVPEGALVEIRRKRIQALSTFLEIVYKHVDGLENGDTCRAALHTSADDDDDDDADADALLESERAMCTHCNHGELIRYLKIHNYWPPIVQSGLLAAPVNEVYEKLTSIPAISYRHMRSTRRHGALGAQQETPGNTHAVCDSGRQVAALIVDAKRKLEMPIATSTIREIRENAVKVGLQGEAVSPRYLPVEEALDEVGAGVRR